MSLIYPTGTYKLTSFANTSWQIYTQPQYEPYVSSGNIECFLNDMSAQRALPVYDYAAQTLANIENLRKDAVDMQMLLQSQHEKQMASINSYAQRNRTIAPNRQFGIHLTNEQLKFIWQIGSELLSDHIKESIKKTATYNSSEEYAKKAQLFAVDVEKKLLMIWLKI